MNSCFLIRVFLFLLVGSLQACSSGADREIKITDSEDTYEFFAKYERHKTQQVQDFINSKIDPTNSVTEEHIAITTTLDDKTQFDLEESPGLVRIKLDKEANSEASYRRVKNLCKEIKKVIDKQ